MPDTEPLDPIEEAEPTRRRWRPGLAFLIVALLTVATLWVEPQVYRCQGDDPAGCGMGRGFDVLIAYAMMVAVGLAALAYLIPRPAARTLAWLVVAGIGLLSVVQLGDTLSANLRATGTADGIDPHPPEAAPDYALRRTMRCYLASEARRADDREAAKAFDDMASYFAGQLWIMGATEGDATAIKIAREEGKKLRAEGEPYDAIASCADLQAGDNDAHRDWLEAAGYDQGELAQRRQDAYKIAPKPDPMSAPTGNSQ